MFTLLERDSSSLRVSFIRPFVRYKFHPRWCVMHDAMIRYVVTSVLIISAHRFVRFLFLARRNEISSKVQFSVLRGQLVAFWRKQYRVGFVCIIHMFRRGSSYFIMKFDHSTFTLFSSLFRHY